LIIIVAVVYYAFQIQFEQSPPSMEKMCVDGLLDYECLAFASGNVNYCNNMNSEQVESCYDEFYLGAVIKSRNQQMCQNIKNNYKKDGCILIANGDAGYCNKYENADLRNICKAILTGDTSSCNSISDIKIKSDCEQITLLKLAFDKNDASVCNQISSGFSRVKCIAFVNQNPDFCRETARRICDENSYNGDVSFEVYLNGTF